MMTTEKELPWFPGYEFQEFIYQSFLVLPTSVEIAANPGAAVTAKKWAKGDFLQGQAFNSGGEGKYTSGATLQFDSGPMLDISVKGDKGIARVGQWNGLLQLSGIVMCQTIIFIE